LTRSRGLAAFAAAGALVLSATACASSGGSSSSSDAPAGTTAATGSALNFFFINAQGSTTGPSYPEVTEAAQAAVSYVNAAGGVSGHPIKLQICFTDETPAQTTNCANQAVAAKPIAVVLGTDADDNDILSVTQRADIPMFANGAFTTEALTATSNSYIVDSYASADLLAYAELLKQEQVKTAAIIFDNDPAGVGVVDASVPGFTANGVTLHKVPVPYPSPDLTPAFSTLQSSKPGAVIVLADPITCAAAMQAALEVGYKGKILLGTPSCETSAGEQAADALAPGQVLVGGQSISLSSSDADVQTYLSAMKKYAPSVSTADELAVSGFQTIMDLFGVLKKAQASGSVTTDSVKNALAVGTFHQFMFGPSATFKCDHAAMPTSPALCSVTAVIGDYEGGSMTNIMTFNGSS
jgi:branched-chain amino acid transport system substrate-binding protein